MIALLAYLLRELPSTALICTVTLAGTVVVLGRRQRYWRALSALDDGERRPELGALTALAALVALGGLAAAWEMMRG